MERKRKDTIFGWLRNRGAILDDLKSPEAGPSVWETLCEWDEITAAGAATRTKSSRRSSRVGRGR